MRTKNLTSNSYLNQIENLWPIITGLMEDEGRISDHTVCELCLEQIPDNKYEIYHAKYEGATYYDLMVVCRKCNRQKENMNLA